jgi:hypothetical protein
VASALESLVVKLALDGKDYESGIKNAKGTLDGFASGAQKVGGVMSLAVTAPIVAIGASALSMASDLNETTSKVSTLFGDQTASIEAWADNSAAAFGLSETAALDSVATIGNMFMQLGASSDQAASTGQGMVQLAADIASFHNVAGGSEEVLGSLNAAFRGEYDSLQKYIPTINAAAVEQAALAATGKTAASELTALEKATAVQALVMAGAGAAVGDFAKTSDGLANSTRIMQAELANVSAELGQALLPIALQVATALGDLLSWFSALSPETKQWIVYIAGAAAAIGPLLAVLGTMASAISTIIGVATAAGPVIAAVGGALTLLTGPIGLIVAAVALLAAAWATDFLGIRTKTQEFWEWLGPATADGLATAKGHWQTFSDNVIEINETYWRNVGQLTATGIEAAQGSIKGGTQIMQGDWEGGLETLRTTAETFWQNIHTQFETQIEAIKSFFTAVDWASLGEAIIRGIADGINSSLSWIEDAARGAAQTALDTAKSWLGISSPSKVAAAELGEPFAEGIGVGAMGQMDAITGSIQGSLNRMVDRLQAPTLVAGASGGAMTINVYLSGSATYDDGRAVGRGVRDELRLRGGTP